MKRILSPSAFAAALLGMSLPMAMQAAVPAPSDTRSDIRHDLNQARQEVRAEMAKARAELDTENLSLDKGVHFGKDSKRKSSGQNSLPEAQITPKGDFLVAGKAVTIDARQRQQLLDYRGLMIELAKTGIDGGERAAMAALDVADVSMLRLIWGGLSGSLEQRVNSTVKQQVEPMVQQICRRLPRVRESQQQLAGSLPEFRPYATLERKDIDDCDKNLRNEFATR